MSTEFYWVAVALVTVISASRLTRLLTFDQFPPTLWVRNRFADWTDKTPRRLKWQRLFFCGYCMSFWTTALVVVTGVFATVYDDPNEPVGDDFWPFTLWWLINGTLAASYLAAILMAHDGDVDDADGESD